MLIIIIITNIIITYQSVGGDRIVYPGNPFNTDPARAQQESPSSQDAVLISDDSSSVSSLSSAPSGRPHRDRNNPVYLPSRRQLVPDSAR